MAYAAFYVADVIFDGIMKSCGTLVDGELLFEAAASLALISAVVVATRFLMDLLRRKAHLERLLSVAAGAFHDIIQDHLRRRALTPSEQDVVPIMIKGKSISDIAVLRGSAEGTVNSNLDAICCKAGVIWRDC